MPLDFSALIFSKPHDSFSGEFPLYKSDGLAAKNSTRDRNKLAISRRK
jgi:hypothetical protein